MSETSGKVLDLRSVFGLKAIVTTPADVTDGAYVEMDVTAEPGCRTNIHSHPDQEETYEVTEGTLEVFFDKEWRPVPAGKRFTVPQGAVHGFRNTGDTPVRFVNVHRPALGFQAHLETLDRLVRAGRIRGVKDPRSLIYMSMSAAEHRPDGGSAGGWTTCRRDGQYHGEETGGYEGNYRVLFQDASGRWYAASIGPLHGSDNFITVFSSSRPSFKDNRLSSLRNVVKRGK